MGDVEDFSAADADQKEDLDEEPRSLLKAIISQLTKGTDLHRVTLPTFVLEPRSMLERITDFMCHPNLIMGTHKNPSPEARFIDVTRYFISGWHIRPKGVKKPFNPVLGEHFRCKYKYEDGSMAYYIAEQTSHHPPISSYFFDSPDNHVMVLGELKPKSKFLGNSAATLMTGETRLFFTDLDEEYILTLPNVYVRGLLFGTMLMELGDTITIKCPKTDIQCELEFKTKGYFSGTYNAIYGKIKKGPKKETIYEITGKWSDKCFIKSTKDGTERKDLFDANKEKVHDFILDPDPEDEPYESRNLWAKVAAAILDKDLDTATFQKSKIEDLQRQQRNTREEDDVQWEPRFFKAHEVDPESFSFRILEHLPLDPCQRKNKLEDYIFKHPPPHPNVEFSDCLSSPMNGS